MQTYSHIHTHFFVQSSEKAKTFSLHFVKNKETETLRIRRLFTCLFIFIYAFCFSPESSCCGKPAMGIGARFKCSRPHYTGSRIRTCTEKGRVGKTKLASV